MTHDTTPVVGEVWERDGHKTRVIEEAGLAFVSFRFKGLVGTWSCTVSEWHVWAANARRAG